MDTPTSAGGLKNWAALGAGFALGFAMSKAIIKLETRIASMLKTMKGLDANAVTWTASLVAIAVYLALAVAMWHKDGALGYFGAGFFGGALVDTVLVFLGSTGV